jgi:type VI secretion system protein ImpH
MGFPERQTMADLKKRPDFIQSLRKEGYNFNFFQALELLEEKFFKEKGIKNPLEAGKIRCVPDSSLVFPPSDIKKIEEVHGVFKLTLTFMGLIGVSSPLPLYFSEYVARHEDNAVPLIDFLNIFNHRCYTLFYKAWKKYRFIRSFSLRETDSFSRRLALLAGLDPQRLSDPAYSKLLAFTGAFAGKSKSKSALTSLLSNFFNRLPVEINEFAPRWVPLRDPRQMGVDMQLGVNSIAGAEKWDVAGKFRIAVGPLPREKFELFLPNSENINKIKELVSIFLMDPLEYDIEVKLQSSELVAVILGENNTRLGETSSLGQSSRRSGVKSIVIE